MQTYQSTEGLKRARAALRNKNRRISTARGHLNGYVSSNTKRKKSFPASSKKVGEENGFQPGEVGKGDGAAPKAEASS